MSEKTEKKKGMTRRGFLKRSLAGAAGLAVGGPWGIGKAGTAEKPITFGLNGVASGTAGMSGVAARCGVELWAQEVNKRGGLLGRQVQVIQRDTQGKPEEAVRYTREFASGGVDFIVAHGSSAETFAVAAVSRELKKLIITGAEATEFTADPKVRSPYCFRFARNALLMGINFGQYAGKISKELGLAKWYTIGADYSLGRDLVNSFVEFLKRSNPAASITGHGWPKLFEPDYTSHITAIQASKPQAVFTSLWGADLIAFLKQAALYGLFQNVKLFSSHLGDQDIITSLTKASGEFPAGVYTTVRYLKSIPNTKDNNAFYDAFVKRFNTYPLHWAWFNYLGALSIETAVKKAGTVDNEAVIRAMRDLRVEGPGGVGPGGTITVRGRDGQIIYYADACGVTIPQAPYLTNLTYSPWDKVLEEETEWLKKKGWL